MPLGSSNGYSSSYSPNRTRWSSSSKYISEFKFPFLCFFFFPVFWLHHTACNILVPCPGIAPMPPTLDCQGSLPKYFFFNSLLLVSAKKKKKKMWEWKDMPAYRGSGAPTSMVSFISQRRWRWALVWGLHFSGPSLAILAVCTVVSGKPAFRLHLSRAALSSVILAGWLKSLERKIHLSTHSGLFSYQHWFCCNR